MDETDEWMLTQKECAEPVKQPRLHGFRQPWDGEDGAGQFPGQSLFDCFGSQTAQPTGRSGLPAPRAGRCAKGTFPLVSICVFMTQLRRPLETQTSSSHIITIITSIAGDVVNRPQTLDTSPGTWRRQDGDKQSQDLKLKTLLHPK